jgi:hypothetical protein
MRRKWLGPVLGGACALALAGCGSLDTGKAERNIKNGLQSQSGTTISRVECPSGVKSKEGDTFNCTAFAADGKQITVNVTQLDGSGSIAWRTGPTGATGVTGATGATGTTGPVRRGEGRFVTFKNRSAGYSIKHPARWKKKGSGRDVQFSFKTRSLHITARRGDPSRPKVVAAAVKRNVKGATEVGNPKRINARAGKAVNIEFERPASGGRQLDMRYVFKRGKKVATLDFGSPAAIVNLRAWRQKVKRMVNSFTWLR